jgi:hypothetical protein
MLGAPLEVDELAVHRYPEHLRVAILELVVEFPESGDFGGAYESEVLRPEEDHAPLALVVVAGDGREVVAGLLGVDLGQVATDERGQSVGGELVANGQQCHVTPPRQEELDLVKFSTTHTAPPRLRIKGDISHYTDSHDR